ncbi:hypothetical protein [Aliarcobacter butzleri]|uniref:hypothetical protein n=1 Tax=Aliarcobacter butzleri TaxID=28197 RepID=UPI002B24A5F6|nr:hypothetical protein [Aliarcobacter butzleri]
MNNFINVRLEAYNHNKTLNAIKHNIRHIQSKSQKLSFDNMSKDRVHNNSNYFIVDGIPYPMLKNRDKTKEYYYYLSQEYLDNRAEHNKLYKASNINNPTLKGRNLRDNQSTWLEGVFTFSDQFKEDLGNKYSFEELCKVANDCVLDIGKKLNANLKYIVFHGDEKTGHFHYAFDNYDNLGRSLFKKINNINDLSLLQDIGFKHFGKIGIQRGQKKEISGVNHQNKDVYWQNKYAELKTQTNSQMIELDSAKSQLNSINSDIAIKNIQLNDLDKNILNKIKMDQGYTKLLEDLKTSIENDKVAIENLKSSVKDLKIEREQLIKDTSKSKEDKKILYAEITTKQNELRVLKDNIQSQIKYKRDLEKDLNSKIDIVISNSKTLVGLDKEKLKDQISKLVKHYLKFNTQLKEINELKEKNEKLKNDNILLIEDNNKKNIEIVKLKEDNSNINLELNTLKKSEIFLKNQLNELKLTTQKQLKFLNNTLSQIKDKMNKFKSFLLFKDLEKDFKEYEIQKESINIDINTNNLNYDYIER